MLLGVGCSDLAADLDGGYAFWRESRDQQAIVDEAGHVVIPCAVREYDSNPRFIVAYQEPVDFCWVAGSPDVRTPGPGFWIVAIDSAEVLGPLSDAQYERARERLRIPASVEVSPTQ